jgi:hypothetical protein
VPLFDPIPSIWPKSTMLRIGLVDPGARRLLERIAWVAAGRLALLLRAPPQEPLDDHS